MDRDTATERDPKPGPVIDSDGTRHYGDADQPAADTDADTADEGTEGRAGADAHQHAGIYTGNPYLTIRFTGAISDADLAAIRDQYADIIDAAPGYFYARVGDHTYCYSKPLTFGYPDTAHSERAAPANPDADPGASGADSDARNVTSPD
jgi:hypothetical protein